MYKIMLDTNVLVDYYLGREPRCSLAVELLEILYAAGKKSYVSAASVKDLFYLVSTMLKRQSRLANDGVLTESAALAATNAAWGCVNHALKHYTVLSVGMSECLKAREYQSVHNDFEDCLQIACAQLSKVDYFVTNDEDVIKHSPIPCLDIFDVVAILKHA